MTGTTQIKRSPHLLRIRLSLPNQNRTLSAAKRKILIREKVAPGQNSLEPAFSAFASHTLFAWQAICDPVVRGANDFGAVHRNDPEPALSAIAAHSPAAWQAMFDPVVRSANDFGAGGAHSTMRQALKTLGF
ncbi:MAG: hypothetical protein KI785_00470 [Devosiaceae bacterium]|nr:hypothetical protein [Devosiaceae bacterium MH13]